MKCCAQFYEVFPLFRILDSFNMRQKGKKAEAGNENANDAGAHVYHI